MCTAYGCTLLTTRCACNGWSYLLVAATAGREASNLPPNRGPLAEESPCWVPAGCVADRPLWGLVPAQSVDAVAPGLPAAAAAAAAAGVQRCSGQARSMQHAGVWKSSV